MKLVVITIYVRPDGHLDIEGLWDGDWLHNPIETIFKIAHPNKGRFAKREKCIVVDCRGGNYVNSFCAQSLDHYVITRSYRKEQP